MMQSQWRKRMVGSRNFQHVSPAVCRTLLFLRKAAYNGCIGFFGGIAATVFVVAVGASLLALLTFAVSLFSVLVMLLALFTELILFVFFVSRYSLGWFLVLFVITNALVACTVAGPPPLGMAAGFGLAIWICVWLLIVAIEFPSKKELEDVLKNENSNSGAAR